MVYWMGGLKVRMALEPRPLATQLERLPHHLA